MYIVSGACDMMPYDTTVHDDVDDALLAMVDLLKQGYMSDDIDVWGDQDGLDAAQADIHSAHLSAAAALLNGQDLFRFGSNDSVVFGHPADMTPAPYYGPDWFVCIVKY